MDGFVFGWIQALEGEFDVVFVGVFNVDVFEEVRVRFFGCKGEII